MNNNNVLIARICILISVILICVVLYSPITYSTFTPPVLFKLLPFSVQTQWRNIYLISLIVMVGSLFLAQSKNVLVMRTLTLLLIITGLITVPVGFLSLSAGYILSIPLRTKQSMSIKQNITFAIMCILLFGAYEYLRIQNDNTNRYNRSLNILRTIEKTNAKTTLTVNDINNMMIVVGDCQQISGSIVPPTDPVVQQKVYSCLSSKLAIKGYTMAQFVEVANAVKKLTSQ